MNEDLIAKFNLQHGNLEEYINNEEYFSLVISSIQDNVCAMYAEEVLEEFERFYTIENFIQIDTLVFKDPEDGMEREFTWETWTELWDELRGEFVCELVDTFTEFLEDKLGNKYKSFIKNNKNIIRRKAEEIPYEWEL